MRCKLAKLGKVITSPVSPLLWCLTFALLPSDALQLFLSLPLLAAPISCKSLSHQGPDWCCSGHGCKVGNWDTDCISKCGESDIFLTLISLCLCFAKCWCVYPTNISTCSDAARWSYVSLIFFWAGTHICKHAVFYASYTLGVFTSSPWSCK